MTDNYIIKCPLHRKETILYTCTNVQCVKTSSVCAACPDTHGDHQSELIHFGNWVQNVSKNVEEGAKYQTFLKDSMSNFDQLLKWCDDDEMHLKKVEQHCQAQKMLISQDVISAIEIFTEKCNIIQKQMDSQLEDFLSKYKETFKSCKQTIEEYLLYRSFSAFQNPNNLIFKLQQSTSREANEIMQGLKRMSSRVKQINEDKMGVTEGLRAVSQRVTDMTYNLPVFAFTEGLDDVCQQLAEDLLQHFKSKLAIKVHQVSPSPLSSDRKLQKQPSQRQNQTPSDKDINIPVKPLQNQQSVPPQLNTISQTNKSLQINANSSLNPQDLSVRPLKKYQLDFSVSSIEVVSETLFALACSQDSYMRIFDTFQKRIHTLQAHGSPIVCIQKWIDQGTNGGNSVLQNNLSVTNQVQISPKVSYLYTLSSDAAIVWTFEINPISQSSSHNGASIPHIFHKYVFPIFGMVTQICTLQDNSCFFLGDKEGGIEVYNYQTKQVQQACMRGKHNNLITSIQMFKKFDKVLVASEDQNISVWKLLYQNSTIQNAYCEQVIKVNLGGIFNISLLTSNPNYIIITTQEGSISLFNLVTQTVTLRSETMNDLTLIVDYLLVDDLSYRVPNVYESFCAIALTQGSKSLRFWRVTHKEQGWVQSESKVDIAITPNESQMGPKMQFVQMPNSAHPLVLIANEPNRELLVYEVVSK